MDRTQHRGKWRKNLSFIPFLLMCVFVGTAARGVDHQAGRRGRSSHSCEDDEFPSSRGHCCNRCPPGFFLLAECDGPHRRSNCSKCPEGQYQDQTNFYPKCFSCATCNPAHNKAESSPCGYKKNRVCVCKDGFTKYVIDSNTWDCISNAGTIEPTAYMEAEPGYHWTFSAGVPMIAVATVVLVVVLVVVLAAVWIRSPQLCTRRQSKRPPGPFPAESPAQTTLLSPTSESDFCIQESEPLSSGLPRDQMPSHPVKLPDCIPKEFNFSLFIYSVLDLVPADRFKELVRRLGVSERDIERAERDHRSFQEGQHQMLKVWGESGGVAVRGTLPHPLVQRLLSTLRAMGLGGCAEALEEQYAPQ